MVTAIVGLQKHGDRYSGAMETSPINPLKTKHRLIYLETVRTAL